MKQGGKGINIIGYTEGKFGLGEAVRLNIKAIESQNISFNLIDFEKMKRNPNYTFNVNFSVNLIQISLGDLDTFFRLIDPELFKFKYSILFLMWESEYIPSKFTKNLNLFNEIWTASTFCRNVFKKVYNNPISVIPHPIEFKLNGVNDIKKKKYFDETKFSFLFIFSYHSSIERKNPFFLIDAFSKAFNDSDEVELIIKTVGAERFKKESSFLIKKVALYKHIKIYNVDLDKNNTNHLINSCDCYVSMHHSEGFGLTMAEAMFFGKPTIATNYSGNTQFMNHENSYLVDSEIGLIKTTDKNFGPNTIWGHPKMEDAILKMQKVYKNKEDRKHKALNAENFIKKELSFKSIGLLIKNRFDIAYEESKDLISNENAYLVSELQFLKVENAHLKREIHRMKKNLVIRFMIFIKNKVRMIKNRLK
ncbi:glycosyltransferase [Zunongwangia sp.]|uniref:glycosyltransferase n=1 Tax=Zunongwangia sp. TaxID=1965325 RepID=UPI003AA824BA